MRDHPRPAAWEGFRAILGAILAAHAVAHRFLRAALTSGAVSFFHIG
jgi:hypothetical protein